MATEIRAGKEVEVFHPIEEIGTGVSDMITRIGSVPLVPGGTSRSFEMKATSGHKRLMLRLTGQVDTTGAGGTVNPLGPVDLITGIRINVQGQPGPIIARGTQIYFRNYKDNGRTPYLLVPANANIANAKPFEAALMLEFALPGYAGGDATVFKTKKNVTYTIEFDCATVATIIAGGVQNFTVAAMPQIDIIAHELPGLTGKNTYNKVYPFQEALAVNPQFKVPLDLAGNFLNEIQLLAYDAGGALSDAVIASVVLQNGQNKTLRSWTWAEMKRFTEQVNPLIAPAICPAGVNFIDLTANNEFKNMIDTSNMKDLALVLNVAAAGTLVGLVNVITEPVTGD